MRGAKRSAIGRGIVAGVVATMLAGCDWTMYRGGAALTGDGIAIDLDGDSVGHLTEQWTADTGATAPSGPVTASGAVVVRVGRQLQAYEIDTGALRWDVALPDIDDPARSRGWEAPAVRGTTVYVGYTDPLFSGGATGGVVGIDARTGDETAGLGSGTGVTSPITFDGDDRWNAWGVFTGTDVITGIEGVLTDGTVLRTGTTTGGTGVLDEGPAVGGGMAYAAAFGGGLLEAFDASGVENCTGEPGLRVCEALWSAPVDGSPRPAVSGATVYAATDSGVSAFATGPAVRGAGQAPEWEAPVTGASRVALWPAHDATTVFVGSGGDGTLQAFAADGCGAGECAPVWQGADATGGGVAPVVANGVVYSGSADGQVHAFAATGCGATTCEPLWSADVPGPPASLAVAHDRLIVTTTSGEVAVFGLP